MNWEQLRAILWLRWRLTRNQFARAGSLNVVLSIVLLALLLLGAAAFGLGGALLGAFAAAKAPPRVLLYIWDGAVFGFLLFWLSGLMVELQRSESIDLTKLLHLPVTLNQVFVFNYAASHFTPSIVLFMPAMLGLCAGLVLGAGPEMALLVPLVLGFIFMVTAWTYCLRGWLSALMVNKRRRRAILVWITIALVLIGQLPNLVFNSSYFHRHRRSNPQENQQPPNASAQEANKRDGRALTEFVMQAHLVLPPGWVGYGAMRLKEHNLLPALCAASAAWVLGALGLLRAYRLTLRFYLGAEKRSELRPVLRNSLQPRRRLLVERHLRWLPDDTAALALATFRCLLRSPELKMAAVLPLVIGVMMMSANLTHLKGPVPRPWMAFAATAAAALASFAFSQTMSNAFGLDRNGFRALVLLPTRRYHILLAKNLAFFPFVAAVAAVLLILAKWLLGMPWAVFLTGVLQVPTAFLLFSLMANLASILVPYRLAQGTLKARKPKPVVVVVLLLSFFLTPVIMTPILIPPACQLLFSTLAWAPWLPVNFLAALVMLAAVSWLYRSLLPLQGSLLQRREQTILREVTEEVD